MVYSMSYARDYTAMAAMGRQAQARPAANPANPKSRPSPGQPFDPNDLSRRLRLVLAEQKAAAEKKRRARAETDRRRKDAATAAASASGDVNGPVPKGFSAPVAPTTKVASSTTTATAPMSFTKPSGPTPSSQAKPRGTSTNEPSTANGGQSNPKSPKAPKRSSFGSDSKADSASKSSSETREDGTHPYVPREAASQFARTATAVGMLDGSLAHRMSRQALKAHLVGHGNDRVATNNQNMTAIAVERKKSLRKSQSNLDKATDRIQVQHSRIPEDSAEIENSQDKSNHRHTFQGIGAGRKSSELIQQRLRRNSTGDLLEGAERDDDRRQSILVEEAINADSDTPVDPATADEHRVDWTQSDEARLAAARNAVRPRMSFWALRGRLGSKNREDKPNPPSPGMNGSEGPLKSPKTGFFSRFKH